MGATGLLGAFVTIQCVLIHIKMSTMEYEQSWLENERDICGKNIPVNADGLLIGDNEKNFRKKMVTSAEFVALIGLYLG